MKFEFPKPRSVRIRPVKKAERGHNSFCGPAAISILTGMNTAKAAEALRVVTGKRSIRGTHGYELRRVLERCGLEMQEIYFPKPLTLSRWLSFSVKQRTAGRVFLVSAGYHWQIISGRRFCCGRIGEVVSVRDERVKRRARVRGVYEISRMA